MKFEGFDDQSRLQELGRLFEGFSGRSTWRRGGEATDRGTTAREALEAFYDAIRDAARLPGSELVIGD